MRHVDEGTIHAWLDEQITDPLEAAWIDAHFRDCGSCRARLAEERAAFDRARTLLERSAPSVERPSFEALVARAGGDVPVSGRMSAAEQTRRRRERLVQFGWAASLALAVGLGWTARELTDGDATRSDPRPAIAEPSPVRDNAATPQAAVPPVAPVPPASAPSAAPTAAARESRPVANTTPQRSESPSPSAPSAPPAPQSSADASAAKTLAELVAPPAALPAAPPTESSAAPAPAAAPPAAAAPVPIPPAAVTPRQELVVATGESPRPAADMADAQWRAVPRTEAAARTGMPLYGIDGLEPQYTGLSADGAQVRTLYRLASGELVELIQQRIVPGSPPPVVDVQATRRDLTSAGRAGIAQRVVPRPRIRYAVRDGMRLTLQTASDAADLGALEPRLRVD